MRMRDEIIALKRRIKFLESSIETYYSAIHELRCRVDYASQSMVLGINSMCGSSETPVIQVPETIKNDILNLPLLDCGIL